MASTRTLAAAAALVVSTAAAAQTSPRDRPYAESQARPIEALSDQQVAELRAGRGMGLALAAELNGYSGPMHVLEHADALRLARDSEATVASAEMSPLRRPANCV